MTLQGFTTGASVRPSIPAVRPGRKRHDGVGGRTRCAQGKRLERALAVLVVLQALCATPARCEEPASPQVQDELTKQEGIYRSQGEKVPGGYITGRGLVKYAELLPSGFDVALRRLGSADRWLDIGAGAGHAILDYYAPEYGRPQGGKGALPGKARAVALSIEDRRTDLWQKRAATLKPGQIRYLHGRRLRQYSDAELGKFRMITDVYGGFSYTENLSLFTEKVLRLLEVNGDFYSLLMSVHLENAKDRPKVWYLTEIFDSAGGDVKVCSWLRSIGCVKVSCESKNAAEWDAPTELIHVRKICNKVSVTALELVSYAAGNPPGRKFRLKQ